MFKKAIIQNEIFQGIMGYIEFTVYQETLTLTDRKDVVLISISEPDNTALASDNIIHTCGFHDVLEMKFWDVENTVLEYEPIEDHQGKQIADFISKNKDKKFLIHCKAGISRSAGVGKAVECILNFDGDIVSYSKHPSPIDVYDRYHPNQAVFTSVVKGSK